MAERRRRKNECFFFLFNIFVLHSLALNISVIIFNSYIVKFCPVIPPLCCIALYRKSYETTLRPRVCAPASLFAVPSSLSPLSLSLSLSFLRHELSKFFSSFFLTRFYKRDSSLNFTFYGPLLLIVLQLLISQVYSGYPAERHDKERRHDHNLARLQGVQIESHLNLGAFLFIHIRTMLFHLIGFLHDSG